MTYGTVNMIRKPVTVSFSKSGYKSAIIILVLLICNLLVVILADNHGEENQLTPTGLEVLFIWFGMYMFMYHSCFLRISFYAKCRL